MLGLADESGCRRARIHAAIPSVEHTEGEERKALYGLFGFALVQWLYFVAINRLPIGIGLLFEFTAPVLIALWARFVWHEPVRRRVWPALGLVLVGLSLVATIAGFLI